MSTFAIFMLAVGLAMDATAAAAVSAMTVTQLRPRHVLAMALVFGGLQALMPVLGWFLGGALGHWFAAWDHWIAFAVLAGVGGKMLFDALRGDEEGTPDMELSMLTLMSLGVATSLDALAVGLTFPLIHAPLLQSVVIIGAVTAVLSALGAVVGKRFFALLGAKLDVVGGFILIAIAIKIVFDHTR